MYCLSVKIKSFKLQKKSKQETSPFVGPLPFPSTVVASPGLAKIEHLRFFDPTFFRAGEIHNHLPVWERLLSGHTSSQVNFINIV